MLMYFLTNTQLHNLTTPIEMICTITTDLLGTYQLVGWIYNLLIILLYSASSIHLSP